MHTPDPSLTRNATNNTINNKKNKQQGKALVMSPVLSSSKCIVPPATGGGASKRVTMSLMARDDELPPAGDKGAPPEPKYSFQNCLFLLGKPETVTEFVDKVDELRPKE